MRIRSARHTDHEALLALARGLDSINLATDPVPLTLQIRRSLASFSGARADRGVYLFVLEHRPEDASGHVVVGSSMIIAKHGTPDEPHYYLRMRDEHRRSEQLDRDFASHALELRWDEDGP